ncbi:MAG: hypothetical protein HRF50_05150 [Phycisphaerae bacterium]|jgi:hypothetical protein
MKSATGYVLAAAALIAGLPLDVGYSQSAGSAPSTRETAVEKLAWMAGGWEGELFGSRVEEHWMRPRAGVMTGMFRMQMRSGALQELLTIAEEEGTAVLRLRHFTPQLAPLDEDALVFRLKEGREGVAVWENPAAEHVFRITYRSDGPDRLYVRLDLHEKEGDRAEEATWTRIQCD